MRPQLLKVSAEPAKSFSVRRDLVPDINNKWHYHAELELIHFNKGGGTQFVGDSISRFEDGDVVLIGSQLPHFWRFDDPYFTGEDDFKADVRVAHFREDFWGDQFLRLPENAGIKALLERARRGLKIRASERSRVAASLEVLLTAEGPERIIVLLQILSVLAEGEDVEPLSSIGFKNDFNDADHDRINTIYEYTLSHFREAIRLNEVAALAGLSPSSFCRYFKARTRKTYSRFLIEIKVGVACKLLIENRLSIKQICFDSGFNNFASFYKHFSIVTGKSPLVYQSDFLSRKKLK